MNAIPRILNRALGRFGYELIPRPQTAPVFSMEGMLERLSRRDLSIASVIDVGAAQGRWTKKAARFFRDAHFLMVDPLEERRVDLERICKVIQKAEYEIAAAGEKSGMIDFAITADLDGSGVSQTSSEGCMERPVPLVAIDDLVRKRKLPAPYLLKLDTHGFEVPILSGAVETLRQTSAIIVEVYNFDLGAGCLRFSEMCAHLEAYGFRCADLAEPLLRQKDSLLWQMDFTFLATSYPGFSEPGYR